MTFVKTIISTAFVALTALSGLSNEPFKYKYQIVANSNSTMDMMRLYEYKEKVIDTYENRYLSWTVADIEKDLATNIDAFRFDTNVRSYYACGTIVIMVGSANGMCLEGSLRKDACDETVIRTKVFLFDLFL